MLDHAWTSRFRLALPALAAVACGLLALPAPAAAQNLELPGCRDHTLVRNDDGSWDDSDVTDTDADPVPLPFEVNFYGQRRSSLYVNNNGNVTFDEPLSDYVPFQLTNTNRVIIAPFFADVDTRPADAGTVTFGEVTFDGRPAFCVLWSEVGYYNQQTDPTNSFQLLLARGTPGTGDFDIVFRYDHIGWELGSASDNVPARAGFSNGDPARSVELSGSAVAGAFLDGGPRGLAAGSVNSSTPGTYVFRVRDGRTGNDPRNVPAGYATDSAWWTWPDRDDDGLPDHWETQGVWVGDKRVDLPGLGADPNRKDAFVYADRVSGERWNDSIKERVRTAFRASPLNIETHFVDGARVLARSEVPTRVIESDEFFAEVTKRQFAATGLGGAPGSVPALAKYVCVCADYYDDSATSTTFGVANGIKGDHMLLTVYEQRGFEIIRGKTGVDLGGGELASDILNAVTLMHELGHLYGLRHHGDRHEPRFDFNYKSIMSYTFSAFGIPAENPVESALVTGSILPRIDFTRSGDPARSLNLDWKMGQDFGALSLIYGQHGERGSFYSTVGEISAPAERLPEEAPIDAILENPEASQAIGSAARQVKAAQNPTPPTPPAAAPRRRRATVTSLRLSRSRLIGGRRIVASFTLSSRARVRVTVDAQRTGRRGAGGRCLRQTSRRRAGRACRYTETVGTRTVQGRAGRNRVAIKRRFAGRLLRRGRYRVGVRVLSGGPTLHRGFRVG